MRDKITPSLHLQSTKESSNKIAIKGGGVACSELQLPLILSNFVYHKQQKRLFLKIMLLSGALNDGVHAWVSQYGMLLWDFCHYSSKFTDPQQHRECFVDNEGCL